MKSRRTLRGSFPEGTTRQIIVDDGRYNHGYKVISFVIAGSPDLSANDAFGTLGLSEDIDVSWDWGDNRQIGWSGTTITGSASASAPFSVIDPDHIVVNDLFIKGVFATAGIVGNINYLIEIEPITMSDDQAIMALIKERSQDDL
jgi:hypothetical protein